MNTVETEKIRYIRFIEAKYGSEIVKVLVTLCKTNATVDELEDIVHDLTW